MNNKAFTLIELLVVVAIIGILAAVGVTTFNGFQEKAKISTVKANQNMIVRYIASETMKCDLGETIIMEGNLSCVLMQRSQGNIPVPLAAVFDKKIKNPFNSQPSPIGTSGSVNGNQNIGVIFIVDYGNRVLGVEACFRLNCSDANNKIETKITIN